MKSTDLKLGMTRPISRRDILHGIGILSAGGLTASSLAPVFADAEAIRPTDATPKAAPGDCLSGWSIDAATTLGAEEATGETGTPSED